MLDGMDEWNIGNMENQGLTARVHPPQRKSKQKQEPLIFK